MFVSKILNIAVFFFSFSYFIFCLLVYLWIYIFVYYYYCYYYYPRLSTWFFQFCCCNYRIFFSLRSIIFLFLFHARCGLINSDPSRFRALAYSLVCDAELGDLLSDCLRMWDVVRRRVSLMFNQSLLAYAAHSLTEPVQVKQRISYRRVVFIF